MSKSNKVFSRSGTERTLDAMKYMHNGYVVGYGAHGDRKYNRTKVKRQWRKELQ